MRLPTLCLGFDISKRRFAGVALMGPEVVAICRHNIDQPVDALRHTYDLIQTLKDAYPAEGMAFIEDAVVGMGGVRVSIDQAYRSGPAMAVLQYKFWTADWVSNTAWKKEIVGKGNASKTECGEWLEEHHPDWYEMAGGDQDVIDAFCIALYCQGVEARRRLAADQQFETTKKQKARKASSS